MSTRVRFAPSPTGPLHIGGLRTALFNYLFARSQNGVFVLRIEDTDQSRYVPESDKYIKESLQWCGIPPDEGPETGGAFGPYRQSERLGIYGKYIAKLIAAGHAYLAFDSSEALAEARAKAEEKGETFQYSVHNRMNFKNSLSLHEAEVAALKATTPYVVRLKNVPGKQINVFDEIRGTITVDAAQMDDKILMKADGMPTYHFANVVDDHLMEITHVIRGEEWLPSLPLHKILYDAFGWEAPAFMHLPLILKPTGKGKLSKRDGEKGGFPVFPLSWGTETKGFKEQGFLPQGLLNYLALLGWNSGNDQELFSLKELETTFSVERIQKGGARFDYEKALWVNQQHLQRMPVDDLLLVNHEAITRLLARYSKDVAREIVELIKERLSTFHDLDAELSLFLNKPKIEDKALQKVLKKNPLGVLKALKAIIADMERWDELKATCSGWASDNDVSFGVVMQCLRIALVGKLAGPDLFTCMRLIGKDVTLKRIDSAIQIISLTL